MPSFLFSPFFPFLCFSTMICVFIFLFLVVIGTYLRQMIWCLLRIFFLKFSTLYLFSFCVIACRIIFSFAFFTFFMF